MRKTSDEMDYSQLEDGYLYRERGMRQFVER